MSSFRVGRVGVRNRQSERDKSFTACYVQGCFDHKFSLSANCQKYGRHGVCATILTRGGGYKRGLLIAFTLKHEQHQAFVLLVFIIAFSFHQFLSIFHGIHTNGSAADLDRETVRTHARAPKNLAREDLWPAQLLVMSTRRL